jgi:hypothetical protein
MSSQTSGPMVESSPTPSSHQRHMPPDEIARPNRCGQSIDLSVHARSRCDGNVHARVAEAHLSLPSDEVQAPRRRHRGAHLPPEVLMPQRAARCAVLCLLGVCLLSACGGRDGQGSAERPSVTASLSPTRTLPSVTRSAVVTDQPEPESQSPRPSRSSTQPPETTTPAPTAPAPTAPAASTPAATTPAQATPSTRQSEPKPRQPTARTSTVIAVPVPAASSPAPSLSSSPSPTPSEAGGTAQADGASTAAWVALVLVVAATVGTWLLVRARKRRTWLTRLNGAKAEVTWFARELIPQLRASGAFDRVVGGWHVAAPRVAAAEDQLTVLESAARSQEDAAQARQLRDAVRSAREQMETLSGPGTHDEWMLDLDDVVAPVEAVLDPTWAGRARAAPPS